MEVSEFLSSCRFIEIEFSPVNYIISYVDVNRAKKKKNLLRIIAPINVKIDVKRRKVKEETRFFLCSRRGRLVHGLRFAAWRRSQVSHPARGRVLRGKHSAFRCRDRSGPRLFAESQNRTSRHKTR